MRRILSIFAIVAMLCGFQGWGGNAGIGGKAGFGGGATAGGGAVTAQNESCITQGSGTSVVCTWAADTINPVAGRSIACTVLNFNSGLTYSVTDSASNSYAAEGSQFNASSPGFWVQNFHFFNLGSTITTTTFNLSGTGSFPMISCQSFTTTGAGPSTDGTSNANASGTTLTAGAITTTQKDYVACGGESQGGSTMSNGAGFTLSAASVGNLMGENLVQGASGSITPTAAISGSVPAGMVCSAYKP